MSQTERGREQNCRTRPGRPTRWTRDDTWTTTSREDLVDVLATTPLTRILADPPCANQTGASHWNDSDYSLALPAEQSPHQARRRADGGAAQEPRPKEAPCPADSELDPDTKRMCDLLIDMAFAKLIRQAAAAKVAEER